MKKINEYFTYLIVFLLPTYLIRFEVFSIPTTLLEILIYLLFIFTLYNAFKNHELKIIKNKKLLFVLAAFAISFLFSFANVQDKQVALGQYKAYIFDPILFVIILYENIDSQFKIKNLINWFVYGALYVSVFSIYQKITGQTTEDGRIIGIFGYSPNYTAFYLVPALVFWLETSLFDKKDRLNIFLNYSITVIIVVAIYLTLSRAALIALVGAFGLGYFVKYICLYKTKITNKIIALILVFIVSVGLGYQFLKPDFSAGGDDSGRITSSNNIRWEIYQTTFKDIILYENNWFFGVGLGNYQSYFSQLTKDRVNYPEWISPKALTAHNLFLHTWVSAGILSLFVFIYLITNFLIKLKFKYKYYFAAFIVLLAILVQGLVDTVYYKNDLSIIFWVVLFIGYYYEFKLGKN